MEGRVSDDSPFGRGLYGHVAVKRSPSMHRQVSCTEILSVENG